MHSFYRILQRLDSAGISYSLGKFRDDTVTIQISVPGERLEIDVESDESILISRFRGHEGDEQGMQTIDEIIEEYRD